MRLRSLIWHMPGRAWAGLAAASGRIWAAMMAAGTLSLWLTAGAAMAWTLMSGWLVVFFRAVLGTDEAFWIIMASLLLVLVSLIALTATELSLRIGKEGIALGLGRDEPPPVGLTVKTETTVTPTGGAATADDGGELPVSERIG